MSKLVIILCTALLVSAEDISEWLAHKRTIQSNVQRAINTSIFYAQRKFEDTKELEEQIVEKLVNKTNKFTNKITDEMLLVMAMVDQELGELIDEIQNVDISDCIQYTNLLENTTETLMTKMNACVAGKLQIRFDYIIGINRLLMDEFDSLTKMSMKSQYCDIHMHDIESSIIALSCSKSVRRHVTRNSAQFMRELDAKIVTLNFMLATYRRILDDCTDTHGLAYYHQLSSNVVNRTKNCIQRNVNKATRYNP